MNEKHRITYDPRRYGDLLALFLLHHHDCYSQKCCCQAEWPSGWCGGHVWSRDPPCCKGRPRPLQKKTALVTLQHCHMINFSLIWETTWNFTDDSTRPGWFLLTVRYMINLSTIYKCTPSRMRMKWEVFPSLSEYFIWHRGFKSLIPILLKFNQFWNRCQWIPFLPLSLFCY